MSLGLFYLGAKVTLFSEMTKRKKTLITGLAKKMGRLLGGNLNKALITDSF